jgi:hypothetical protein
MLGYDIGGAIFETHSGLLDSNLFDISVYQKSDSCVLYKSELKFKLLSDLTVPATKTIESSIASDSLDTVFTIQSDDSYADDQQEVSRELLSHTMSTNGLKNYQNISISKLGLNSSEDLDI